MISDALRTRDFGENTDQVPRALVAFYGSSLRGFESVSRQVHSMEKPTTETVRHQPSSGAGISAEEARETAREAFVFGLPLVYIATQLDVASHVAKAEQSRAPLNQFAHFREFPDASNKTIVGLNVDTLYSAASLDVAPEPLVLSVPEMGDRFWIMQLIDAWNNVPHAPGSRTAGGAGGRFVIAGPEWRGAVPAGMTELRMPTNLALLAGRTYTKGPGDYAAVHALQDQYQLVPLSRWGERYTAPENVPLKPGVDGETPVPRQINALSAEAFFGRLNNLLARNPASPADAPVLARAAKLGIQPGANFDIGVFSPEVRAAIEAGVRAGQQDIRDEERRLGDFINGWTVALDLGRYGTKYTYRAAWTLFGVGGNLAEDAIYPLSVVDGDGNPYDAAKSYVLHFTREQLPPVTAFWSLTLYDSESYLVPNPINRSALGDRSDLSYGADGSLTLYIQSQSPGKSRDANWLPAPQTGGFKLALRLYGPKREVFDRTWAPPPVRVTH